MQDVALLLIAAAKVMDFKTQQVLLTFLERIFSPESELS